MLQWAEIRGAHHQAVAHRPAVAAANAQRVMTPVDQRR